MTNVAIAAEMFLSDVEQGLGERHELCGETEKRSNGGIKDIGGIQVKCGDKKFHNVEDG